MRDASVNRYHRQMLIPQIGEAGQRSLASSRVLLVGCGALGSVIAEQLVRAGVGTLLIADRDIVELTNLQRQVLFDESDARDGVPKAIAAARRLGSVNSEVKVEPLVLDVHSDNIESLLPVDLILDGTDNVATRYLINDVSVKHAVPWVYGACVGTVGRVMTIIPGQTPCLRCVFEQPPAPTELPSCDTAGVLGPVASVVASLQALAAIKLLSGNHGAVMLELLTLDLWQNRIHAVPLSDAKRVDCPTCGERRFEFLDHAPDANAALCGRDAVQVRSQQRRAVDLGQLNRRLSTVGVVSQTLHLLRCDLHEPAGVRLTVFPDARAIIQGVSDVARAKSLYAKYIGS